MANIKSQIKRIKQNEKRELRNKSVKSALKTFISKFEKAVAEKNKESATSAFNAVVKKLDDASSKGTIHKNRAADKKSRLAKKLNTL